MITQLTASELERLSHLLKRYRPAQAAIAALKQCDRQLDVSFNQLCAQTIGIPLGVEASSPQSFWKVTLDALRPLLCNDPHFQAKVEGYRQKPDNAALLTDLVLYLLSRSGMPINPAMSLLLLMYILKVELPSFCANSP